MNQFIKYSLALVLVVCLAVVCHAAEEEVKSSSDFNFNSVMQGAWSVEVSEINIGEASNTDEEFPTIGLYNFTHSALHDGILVGTYTQQGSEEDSSDVEFKLFAQTEDQTGSLKMIKRKKEESEEEEEVAEARAGDEVVFEIPFTFASHKPQANQQAPVILASSQGKFTGAGARKGTYEFLFVTKEQFVLSLIFEGENKIERIVGTKKVNSELSFFQKYGSTIMISVFFIGSRLLTRNLAPQGQQAPAAAATQ